MNKVMNSLKKAIVDNKVIALFVVLCLGCMFIADTNISYIVSEVFSRFSRNACLVLSLIIPCLAGLGMNFGIVVGAIAAQISIFVVVHFGFTGLGGFMLCILLSTPLSILFGWLVGKLYNNTKGSEMIAGLILGFFAAGVYRLFVLYIIGGVIPFDDPNLLPRGFGLRNAYDLTGNLKYALDSISFLNVCVVIGLISLLVAAITCIHAKKTNQGINKKSIISKVVVGVAALVFGMAGRFIPILNILFGGKRLILTDVALFGGLGLIIFAVIKIAISLKKGEKAVGKFIGYAVVGILLMVGTVIPSVREIYQAVQLPSATYGVIVLFCFFNNWIMETRLGQNMRTVGQNRSVATSAGVDVDKTRIIATCISTVLAAWGQLIFLQNLGTFNTVQQQDNVGLYSVAAILVGGATVQKANNKHATLGVVLFHTLFVVAPLAATKLVGDSAISEYIRMFISYGVIAVSLALHAWKSAGGKKSSEKTAAEGQTAAMLQPMSPDLPE